MMFSNCHLLQTSSVFLPLAPPFPTQKPRNCEGNPSHVPCFGQRKRFSKLTRQRLGLDSWDRKTGEFTSTFKFTHKTWDILGCWEEPWEICAKPEITANVGNMC